jgi:hypothetical protein
MNLAYAAGIAACCAGTAWAAETCVQRPGHYDAGLAYHLAKRGVPYTAGPERGVCVAEERSSDMAAAMTQLDSHYWEVAKALKNACEERAYVEWASRAKLRFDVGDVVDLSRKPAGRMLHLRSFTAEEAVEYQRKLDAAAKNVDCEARPIG